MNYCPNPDCDYLRRTGSVAEYEDMIASCLDCGTHLVGKANVKNLIAEVEFSQEQKWFMHWKNRIIFGVITALALLTGQIVTIFIIAIALFLFFAWKHPVNSFEVEQPWLIAV